MQAQVEKIETLNVLSSIESFIIVVHYAGAASPLCGLPFEKMQQTLGRLLFFSSDHREKVQISPKGQLMFFWCLQIFQKIHEIISRISALASKKRSNQKNKGTIIGGFSFDSLTLFFRFDLFLRNPLVDLKTPKKTFRN